MATKNVQLCDYNNVQLMPKTLDSNVIKPISTLITSKSGTHTGSQYLTLNTGAISANTKYRLTITASSALAGNAPIVGINSTAPGTVLIDIGTMQSGETSAEFIFTTGNYTVNRIQIRGTQARTFNVAIYIDTEIPLDEKLDSIDAEFEAVYSDLHENADWGFQTIGATTTINNKSQTQHPWSPLPHIARKGMYCKLEVTNITVTKTYTVRLQKDDGNLTVVGTIGNLSTSDTSKTFYFVAPDDIRQIQYMSSDGTITCTSKLSVMSGFYKDYREYLKYLSARAKYKSNVKCIAHQGFSTDTNKAECRLSTIINAARNHFDGVEVDIVFSSDDEPFLCHETSFKSGGETITIENKTAEELVTYNFYSGTICHLDDAVRVCKLHGMDIILDHTVSINTPARANKVLAILNKYKAWRNVIWTTSSSILTKSRILELYPQARVMIVQNNTLTQANITNANNEVAAGHNVVLSFNYEQNPLESAVPMLSQLDPRVQVSIYTFDPPSTNTPITTCEANLNSYFPYADYVLSGVTNKFIADTGFVNVYDASGETE